MCLRRVLHEPFCCRAAQSIGGADRSRRAVGVILLAIGDSTAETVDLANAHLETGDMVGIGIARWVARRMNIPERAERNLIWIAIPGPLPNSLSRVAWALGTPIGISRDGLRQRHAPGTGSIVLMFLAVVSEGTAWFTHAYLLHTAMTVPRWVPVIGGRYGPRTVVGLLFIPIATLLFSTAQFLGLLLLDRFPPNSHYDVATWNITATSVVIAVWGIALTCATWAYARRYNRENRARRG
jgi:hypothetical protein